jgi:type IV pilus modification protein PilV
MMSITKHSNIRSQSGVGLIEVLVAILLLAMGLLGAVALQFATAKEQRSSQFVTRAALLGNEIAERMRANRAGVEAGLYSMKGETYASNRSLLANLEQTIGYSSPRCMPMPSCISPIAVVDNDLIAWSITVVNTLPQAAAIVLPVALPEVGGSTKSMPAARDIVLAWVEPVMEKNADGAPIPISQTLKNNGCPALIEAPVGVRCYQMRFVL